jgi:PAS domain S-box-containing protein
MRKRFAPAGPDPGQVLERLASQIGLAEAGVTADPGPEFFEALPEPFVITDPQGNLRDANRAAIQLLERQKRHVLGKPLVLFLAAGQGQELQQKVAGLVQAKGQVCLFWEASLQRRKSGTARVAVSVMGIRTPHGSLSGFCWLLRPA